MRVDIDPDRCRGHGVCTTLCPQVFSLTDAGYAVAETAQVPADFEGAVREAIADCPERAISES